MLKEFLEKNDHFKIAIQEYDGGFKVEVYNTTLDFLCEKPVFKHFISGFDIQNTYVDFETLVVTPINNWLEECENKRKQRRLNR